MNRNKLASWIGVLACAGMLTGCSLSGSGGSPPIDPPQTAETNGPEALPASAEAETGNTFTASLFALDGDGYVAPISVKLPFDTTEVAKKTLQYMVKGGPGDELLPEGFTALLPEGTEVVSLDIDSAAKTATIDFNEEFLAYEPDEERRILEGLVWAMTSYPSVEYVQLWVDGKPLKEMPVLGTPLDAPLSRKFGINVERASGVEFTRSTPVTLYFLNETADGFTYYVPVTRLIGLTEDPAAAAVAELVRGPLAESRLEAVFMPVDDGLDHAVTLAEGRIHVDLDAALAEPGGKLPVEGLEAIVLSLTELMPSAEVHITVDGTAHALATDDRDFGSAPVTRPKAINPLEL